MMARRATSLRMRLTAIILLPVLLIAALAGAWQLANARATAAGVFDRSLLSAALAVARDVAVSEGDALSERTRDLLSDTSGGTVFYHVYAPDGVIVAGYATPPVGIAADPAAEAAPTYFDAIYFGRDVRGVRLQTQAQIDGFFGVFTTTVWQDREVRAAFVRELMIRPVLGSVGIILSLAFIVWFGVRLGLRPLLDLEEAIDARSGEELSPIQRAVPTEVAGIVETLNRLFAMVSASMAEQAEFISNAAHQLRNPIAGVLSLAEAIDGAKSPEDAKQRSHDLLEAARETADLSKNLLLFERARALSVSEHFEDIDLSIFLRDLMDEFRAASPKGVNLEFRDTLDHRTISGDPVMLREAIRNLVDNAFRHAGPEMTRITVSSSQKLDGIAISVEDDGEGLEPHQLEKAAERFVGYSVSSGGGLGLSIVSEIARNHGGRLMLERKKVGLKTTIVIADLGNKDNVN